MNAINTLVTDLKSAGIWSKMKAIYPFVGGSAASHRFNLKDPRTVDAAFYLDFYGGVTHTSAGATFNGTTGYADMKLMRSQLFTNTDGMIGMYTPTLSSSGSLFAVSNMVNADFSGYYNGTQLSNNMYPNTSVSYTTQLKGFNCFDVFINVVTCRSIFKNGVKVAFGSGYSGISPDYKVYMAATNRAGSSYGDNFAGVYSFSFFSNTLTASENTSLYTAVQKYQTTLGRQIGTPVGTSNIITNGMIFNLDASNPTSYSGTGTTWIDLVAGNNGTLVNGPTYDSTNGGSILFDGVNDRVSTFPTKLIDTSSKTIDVWFKSTSSVRQGLCGTRTNNGITAGWVFTINRTTSGRLSYFHTGSGVAEFIAGISTNTWYNAVVTHDSTTGIAKVYLNGTLLGSSNVGSITSSTYNGVIGDEDDTIPSCPFKGNIPKVTMYSRVLSDTEILQNFNATKSRFGI
jgi:hypothetical protein